MEQHPPSKTAQGQNFRRQPRGSHAIAPFFAQQKSPTLGLRSRRASTQPDGQMPTFSQAFMSKLVVFPAHSTSCGLKGVTSLLDRKYTFPDVFLGSCAASAKQNGQTLAGSRAGRMRSRQFRLAKRPNAGFAKSQGKRPARWPKA